MKNCYYCPENSHPNQRFGGFLVPFVGGLLIGGLAAPYFINNKNEKQYAYPAYYPSQHPYTVPYQYGNYTYPYPYMNPYNHYYWLEMILSIFLASSSPISRVTLLDIFIMRSTPNLLICSSSINE